MTVLESLDDLNIYIPKRDVFAMRTEDYDSLTKVFVNGVLVPFWVYEEIASPLDPTGAVGIKLIPNTVYDIYPGDVITIMYAKDRDIIIGRHPIEEEDFHSVYFNKIENWKSIKNIEELYFVDYEFKYYDKFNKKILEYECKSLETNYKDNYVPKDDKYDNNMSRNENVRWNNTMPMSMRLMLNSSKLNKSLTLGLLQDQKQSFGFSQREKYSLKSTNVSLEMFRIVDGEKEVIKFMS